MATASLATALLYAAHEPAAAKTMKKPMHMASASVAQGKALSSQFRCNGCHSANLQGKPGFSPSLHQSGVLKEYNAKTWEKVLDTGMTNDGKMVKKPMPVYHMPKAKADAIYAYCKTLK